MAQPPDTPARASVPASSLTSHLAASWDEHRRQYRSACRACRRNPTEQRVHHLRVTLRRLLAHLDALPAAPTPSAARQTRRKLRAMLQVTAAARDAQVQWRLLSRYLPRDGRPERQRCARRLKSRAGHQAGKLMQALQAQPTLLKSVSFGDFLASPLAQREPRLGVAIRLSFQRSLARLRRRLRAARGGESADLHRARLAVKEVRYLAEITPAPGGVFPGLKPLQTLQSALGELHDLDLFLKRLEKMASRHARGAAWWQRRRPPLQRHRSVLLAALPGLPAKLGLPLPARPGQETANEPGI